MILKCSGCGEYTLKDICPQCGSSATNPRPPKYSPEDKLAKYRREAKFADRKEKSLL